MPKRLLTWSPESWHKKKIAQMPPYPDKKALEEVKHTLSQWPPLVFGGEVRILEGYFARASRGEVFVFQAGDCAETFENLSGNYVKDMLKLLLQASLIFSFGMKKPVVKVGRIAGQFSKPRSSLTETKDGKTLPSYFGDMFNASPFDSASRVIDPYRHIKVYQHSSATLNLLRAFCAGGYNEIDMADMWTLQTEKLVQTERYKKTIVRIREWMSFLTACGVEPNSMPFYASQVYTSHEMLNLHFEQAMTRKDSLTNRWYDTSAHMLWIGDRTRQVDGAHVEFARGIHNPIGIKVGPTMLPDDFVRIHQSINPRNLPGKVVLICRMGVSEIEGRLLPLARRIRENSLNVLWMCDPMHGNTVNTNSGYKTRYFDNILEEFRLFSSILMAEGCVVGGIHAEVCGQNVAECLGGNPRVKEEDMEGHYTTFCDPRLNASQTLEMAFALSDSSYEDHSP